MKPNLTDDEKEAYKKKFEGELQLEVEEGAVSVQQPIRNVPFALERILNQNWR